MRKLILVLGALLWRTDASGAVVKVQPLDVRLGAWEGTTVSDISGMEIPRDVSAHMPPDQRARAEAALKARKSKGPTTKTRQSCVTKESMDKFFKFENSGKSGCKRTVIESTSRRQVFHEECVGAKETASSDIHFDAVDSTHVKGSVRGLVTPAGGGHPMRMNFTFNARWLGSDCSQLKNRH